MFLSIGSSTAASSAAQIATNLFSKLDTKKQGFIDESDLQSAFAQLSTNGNSSTPSTSSVDAVFKQLDGNGDGKVTPEELAASLQKVSDQLDSHFHHARMHHHSPPQGADDGGLTKDQLTSLAQNIGTSETDQASKISNLVANFDKADGNHDGKVSMQEARTFDQVSNTSAISATSTSSDASNNGSSSAQNGEADVLRRILQLVRAYGDAGQDSTQTASTNSISATA